MKIEFDQDIKNFLRAHKDLTVIPAKHEVLSDDLIERVEKIGDLAPPHAGRLLRKTHHSFGTAEYSFDWQRPRLRLVE